MMCLGKRERNAHAVARLLPMYGRGRQARRDVLLRTSAGLLGFCENRLHVDPTNSRPSESENASLRD